MTATQPTSTPIAPAGAASAPVGALLQAKLAMLRRRHVGVAVLSGVALALVVSLELLALSLFLDWWLELPWAIRLVLLIAQLAVFGSLFASLVYRPWARQPGEDALALMMEKARPEFRSRLIASIQLARPGSVPAGASLALARALVRETEQLSQPLDFAGIVSTYRLKQLAAVAIVVPLLALLGFLANPEVCRVLLRRAVLSTIPVPRKTRVVVPVGDRVVGIGDSVWLEGYAQGILPGNGYVVVQFRQRGPEEFALQQDRDNRAHFGRLLENVQNGFTFQFHLGDGVSPVFNVRAVPRPAVQTMECEQIPPAYTQLKPSSRSPGDISVLAGSTLRIHAIATKDLESATLRLAGVDRALPLPLDRAKPREVRAEFVAPGKGLTGFQIQMRDTDAMDSRDSAVFRVDVLPDKPPVARITYPDRREQLVTRRATLLLAFEASDDFAIARLRLKYKTDAVDAGAEKSIELDLETQQPARVKRRYEWTIADSLPEISEGNVVEYWIEAEDNNNVTGPGVGVTEHQLAKVVSEADKRADLLNRAADSLSGISDVTGDQEKLNQTLGALIRQKAGLR